MHSDLVDCRDLVHYFCLFFVGDRNGQIKSYHIGPKQKVGIRVGRSEKVDFYKGTFRAQTGTIVHSRNFLVLFRP